EGGGGLGGGGGGGEGGGGGGGGAGGEDQRPPENPWVVVHGGQDHGTGQPHAGQGHGEPRIVDVDDPEERDGCGAEEDLAQTDGAGLRQPEEEPVVEETVDALDDGKEHRAGRRIQWHPKGGNGTWSGVESPVDSSPT